MLAVSGLHDIAEHGGHGADSQHGSGEDGKRESDGSVGSVTAGPPRKANKAQTSQRGAKAEYHYLDGTDLADVTVQSPPMPAEALEADVAAADSAAHSRQRGSSDEVRAGQSSFMHLALPPPAPPGTAPATALTVASNAPEQSVAHIATASHMSAEDPRNMQSVMAASHDSGSTIDES